MADPVLANRSDIDLDRQVMAPGATWLDYRLVERERMPLAIRGVGQEVRNAMEASTEHLATDGLVRLHSQLAQEVDLAGLDLERTLLLGPVTIAGAK